GEEESVGGEDAERDPEKRVERSDHVAERVLVDEILQVDVGAERQPLELAIEANGGRLVDAHGALVTGASSAPPRHARRSGSAGTFAPSFAATSARSGAAAIPNFSLNLCCASSEPYVMCKSPMNVSSTPLLDVATAGKTGSLPRRARSS